MDTSRQGAGAAGDYRRSGAREALLGLAVALVAAAPYVTVIVGGQIRDYVDWPPPLVDGVLWGVFLSPFAGLIGCGLGVGAFRSATGTRERVIAIVATVISALAIAAFTLVMIAIVAWNTEGYL